MKKLHLSRGRTIALVFAAILIVAIILMIPGIREQNPTIPKDSVLTEESKAKFSKVTNVIVTRSVSTTVYDQDGTNESFSADTVYGTVNLKTKKSSLFRESGETSKPVSWKKAFSFEKPDNAWELMNAMMKEEGLNSLYEPTKKDGTFKNAKVLPAWENLKNPSGISATLQTEKSGGTAIPEEVYASAAYEKDGKIYIRSIQVYVKEYKEQK